jgi:Mn-dependent DtxR family transcriptional regulator
MRDEKIIRAMRRMGRPVSTETLSIFLRTSPDRISKKLNVMKKYGMVKKITARRIEFWDEG